MSWRLPGARIGLTLLAVLVVGACGGGPPPAQTPNRLVVGLVGNVSTINQLLSGGAENEELLAQQLFLELVRERPGFADGPPSYQPLLAESWELSPDQRELTFHLRHDARWSDGEPVTAADVRFTWQAQVSPGIGWLYGPTKEDIVDVEAVDSHTVRFRFARPSATAIETANTGVILPAHAWSKLPFDRWVSEPQWFLDHLLTSGPFTLAEWHAPERIALAANPYYFEPAVPSLRRVLLLFAHEDSGLLPMLESGEADFVAPVRAREADQLARGGRFSVRSFPSRQFNFVSWNTGRPMFASAAVRRALAMAVNRQEIVDTLWFGRAQVGCSPILSSIWAHAPELAPWPYDPEQAAAILAREGWRDSDGDRVLDRNGLPFRFELVTNSGSEVRWDALQMIRRDLARLGIEVTLRRQESNALASRLTHHDFDAALSAFAIDTSLDLSYAFHSRSIDEGYNYGGYENPTVDRLIDEVAAATELRAVLPQLQELQRILHRDQPMLFLWEPEIAVAFAPGLVDVGANALSLLYDLEHWRWRPGRRDDGPGLAAPAPPADATSPGGETTTSR